MKVEVYWNLNKKCFSVRHKGKVIGHHNTLRLRDVKWVVQPGGNARVRKYRRKNVHAFARGTLVDDHRTFWFNIDRSDFKRIIYNPYEYTTFVTRGTKTPVHTSDYVIFETIYHATDNYHGPRIAAL